MFLFHFFRNCVFVCCILGVRTRKYQNIFVWKPIFAETGECCVYKNIFCWLHSNPTKTETNHQIFITNKKGGGRMILTSLKMKEIYAVFGDLWDSVWLRKTCAEPSFSTFFCILLCLKTKLFSWGAVVYMVSVPAMLVPPVPGSILARRGLTTG